MRIEKYILQFAKKALNKNKHLNLLLSGGNSIKKIYKKISEMNIEWKNVNISLIDERIVEKKSKRSNLNLIKNIFRKQDKINYIDVKNLYREKNTKKLIKLYNKSKPLLIAGFGSDGHFASIFSNSQILKFALNLKKKPNLIKTDRHGDPLVKRITMNMPLILKSNKIILVTNSKKNQILRSSIKRISSNYNPLAFLIKQAKDKILIYDGKNLVKLNRFK